MKMYYELVEIISMIGGKMKSIEIIKSFMGSSNYCEVIHNDSEGNKVQVSFKANDPISLSEIIGIAHSLPNQYVDFLLFSNGMELYNYKNIDGLLLLSVKDIERFTQYARNTFEEDWEENIVIFAKIIGEDNYLGFKIDENGYEVLDCYFEELPFEWSSIAHSFDEFLVKYIEGDGRKFWIN